MYAVGRGGKMPHCVCIQAVSLPTGSRLIGVRPASSHLVIKMPLLHRISVFRCAKGLNPFGGSLEDSVNAPVSSSACVRGPGAAQEAQAVSACCAVLHCAVLHHQKLANHDQVRNLLCF